MSMADLDPASLVEVMRIAVETARRGIAAGQSPFAAVIADPQGRIIVADHNRVRADSDITAHAEMVAIREACLRLHTIDLSGHLMVSTCEPCPMCASAIHWARLEAVAFGARISDAKQAGFHEIGLPLETLFREGGCPIRVIPDLLRGPCAELFSVWLKGPNPQPY